MKPNITTIEVPSPDKSTVGALLARRLGPPFVDVDIVVQEKESRLLKEIIAEGGTGGFLKAEERINAGLNVRLSIIVPGGSVIYDEEAMKHLKEISEVAYLKMSYEGMKNRIDSVMGRSVTLKPDFTLKDPYNGRVPHYEEYADIIIDEEGKTPGEAADGLRLMVESVMDRDMIQCVVEEQRRRLEEKGGKFQGYEAEIVSPKEQLAQI